jgi:hypothetical protein
VSEIIHHLGSMLSSRPGSIKKGNRKSEILLRDAEVGVAPIFFGFGKILSLTGFGDVYSTSPRLLPSSRAKSISTRSRPLTIVGKRFF